MPMNRRSHVLLLVIKNLEIFMLFLAGWIKGHVETGSRRMKV